MTKEILLKQTNLILKFKRFYAGRLKKIVL